ncbi:MarR family transcriptional regulator [Brevibacillus sp. SYP-B805]|uniref:MarR family winged helix-turn-helix transcriptional regulator n=1 Tax=Brevibacillus sp. SYP-B805 TaxID=1578199 RepID=UPI0013EBEADF|nr:MarR family transcriptional regulator [Brevibacillus sp. SYP-B805]NGQ96893.1 MarR family transcriptional regulator [Brevibacillus sp. SYP-B805]
MDHKRSARQDLNQSLLDASRRLSTQTVMFHQAVASYLGLNITDHKCLDLVLGMGKATAGQLAELTGLTTGAITSALNRLEKAGYVRRVKDPHDLRFVIVEPVYDHLHRIKEVFAPLNDAMTELHSRYSPDELRIILDYMERSIQVLNRQADHLRKRNKPDTI